MAKKKSVKKTDLLTVYQRVFKSDDGITILKDLMKQYYLMTPTFGRSVNSDLMLIREGQRSVILALLRTTGIDIARMRDFIDTINQQDGDFYE